eukprot:960642-Amphidinium_carterae.1
MERKPSKDQVSDCLFTQLQTHVSKGVDSVTERADVALCVLQDGSDYWSDESMYPSLPLPIVLRVLLTV